MAYGKVRPGVIIHGSIHYGRWLNCLASLVDRDGLTWKYAICVCVGSIMNSASDSLWCTGYGLRCLKPFTVICRERDTSLLKLLYRVPRSLIARFYVICSTLEPGVGVYTCSMST